MDDKTRRPPANDQFSQSAVKRKTEKEERGMEVKTENPKPIRRGRKTKHASSEGPPEPSSIIVYSISPFCSEKERPHPQDGSNETNQKQEK
jgi:hypothetical protein